MEEEEEVGFDEPDMQDVFCVSSAAKLRRYAPQRCATHALA